MMSVAHVTRRTAPIAHGQGACLKMRAAEDSLDLGETQAHVRVRVHGLGAEAVDRERVLRARDAQQQHMHRGGVGEGQHQRLRRGWHWSVGTVPPGRIYIDAGFCLKKKKS
jgi:hypothetical protein